MPTTLDPQLSLGGGSQLFPADIVAPIPFSDVEPPLQLNNLYVTPGSSEDNPVVAVQFRQPFELPQEPYRISVLMGDPTGRRLRASLVANGGRVTGRLEEGDGEAWRSLGPLAPPTFDPSGLAGIPVPVNESPGGGAIWAEAELGSDGKRIAISPYFSRESLLGRSANGRIVAAPFGRVTEANGGPSEDTARLPAGPQLTVINRSVIVDLAVPTPTELLDHPVVAASDYVRVAPNFNLGAVVTHYVWINRTEGTLKLIDGLSQPPVDRTAAAKPSWVVEGFPDPAAAMSPGRLVFDLDAVADALGIDLTAGPVALGLRREFVLDDGRIVTAEAVLATTDWFAIHAVGDDPMATANTPVTSAVPAITSDEEQRQYLLTVAFGATVLLLLVIALSVRRARKARRSRQDAADALERMAEEAEQLRRTREHRAISDPAKQAQSSPVAPERSGEPMRESLCLAGEGAVRRDADGGGDGLDEPEPLLIVTLEDLERQRQAERQRNAERANQAVSVDAIGPGSAPEAERQGQSVGEQGAAGIAERQAARRRARFDPAQALAGLDEELEALTSRLRRLPGQDDESAPASS
ncbi:MAG: hypothetical protein N2037_13825 [Acidimicrobiales bacterium]|nr:hypothetical protein [Acidimicrobiales bacterium]